MPQSRAHRRIVLVATLSCVVWGVLAAPVAAAPPKVNGEVDQIGPFRVLRVWGTPQEMGFAHGYLLADGIVRVLQESAAALPQERRTQYDGFVKAVVPFVDMPDRTMQELRGIMAGIRKAMGKLPTIKALGRPMSLDDLVFNNAGDMVRAFGCSGFTVWGAQAGDLGVITTRNFDYPSASSTMHDEHLLLVREPTGRKQVLSITWPSFIGAFTGVNEDGVCAFMHDGTGGLIPQPDRKRTPLPIVISDVLEQTSPNTAIKDMEAALNDLSDYPFSYMVRMATPRVEGSIPGYVLRIDRTGVGFNRPNHSSCITTNHYLTNAGKPVPQANADSLTRYQKLRNSLATAMTREAAWAAQDAVASSYQAFPTLHTLIVYPERREMDLAFAKWKGGRVVPATKFAPVTIRFDDLFRANGSRDRGIEGSRDRGIEGSRDRGIEGSRRAL